MPVKSCSRSVIADWMVDLRLSCRISSPWCSSAMGLAITLLLLLQTTEDDEVIDEVFLAEEEKLFTDEEVVAEPNDFCSWRTAENCCSCADETGGSKRGSLLKC